MIKRFLKVVRNSKNWISIIVLGVTIIVTVVNFIWDDEKYTGKVISALLSLIAVEFFSLTVGLLNDIFEKVDNFDKRGNTKMFRAQESLAERFVERAKCARHDVIMVGSTLSHLYAHQDFIIELSRKVNVRLMATNVENGEIRSGYNDLIERTGHTDNLSHLEGFENKDKIEIRTIDKLPTAYFVGCDLEYPSAIVGAAHLFSSGSQLNFPCVELYPNDDMFDVYRAQIEDLWRKGDSWKGSGSRRPSSRKT